MKSNQIYISEKVDSFIHKVYETLVLRGFADIYQITNYEKGKLSDAIINTIKSWDVKSDKDRFNKAFSTMKKLIQSAVNSIPNQVDGKSGENLWNKIGIPKESAKFVALQYSDTLSRKLEKFIRFHLVYWR